MAAEDNEFDFARTRYRAKFQKSRQDTAFPRRIRDTANLQQVDVSRYGRCLGNQQHGPAKALADETGVKRLCLAPTFQICYNSLWFYEGVKI